MVQFAESAGEANELCVVVRIIYWPEGGARGQIMDVFTLEPCVKCHVDDHQKWSVGT